MSIIGKNTIGTKLNNLLPGQTSRHVNSQIQNLSVNEDMVYGQAVKLTADGASITAIEAGDTQDVLIGVVSRPQTLGQYDFFNPNEEITVKEEQTVGVKTLGYIAVELQQKLSEPVKGKPVFMRVTEDGTKPTLVIGGFETEADGGNCIELTDVVFASNSSYQDVAEIHILKERM